MHRVLEHIDRNLEQPLELDRLASVANFSAFHFHRVFSAWMGEPLGAYVRRRRLEIGAQRLLAQPLLPVLEIALAVGFVQQKPSIAPLKRSSATLQLDGGPFSGASAIKRCASPVKPSVPTARMIKA